MTCGAIFTAFTARHAAASPGHGRVPAKPVLWGCEGRGHSLMAWFRIIWSCATCPRARVLARIWADTVAGMYPAAATVNGDSRDVPAPHVTICAVGRLTETGLCESKEQAARIACTPHVPNADHSGDSPELLAARTPCVPGYDETGAHPGQKPPRKICQDRNPTCTGPDSQAVCQGMGRLITTADPRPGTDPQTTNTGAECSPGGARDFGTWG